MSPSASDRTPILVGCADVTDLTTPAEQGRSPYELIAQAARAALADAGGAGLAAVIDTVAMLRQFSDTSHRFASRLGGSDNPPASIASRLKLNPSRLIYTWNGGNMPQYLVNQFAEQIAQGRMQAALICGGEALRTQQAIERANLPVDWHENPGGSFELIGESRRGWSDHEDRHDMRAAIVMYPLIENAIRAARGRSIERHMREIGALMARFAAVAAANPLATRREGFTAEQLTSVGPSNRWIGFPYPKLLNANAYIDQSAALVMTSVGMARRMGIAPARWVYLHGCADAHDHWFISQRPRLDESPAIRAASRQALAMAGLSLDQIASFDLYSCFASAVQIGCAELGLPEDDPRGLTLTGGLPYFGGPGNNYVTHSISAMMNQVRSRPGMFGMVTANGNYVTKHSFGIYSTTPTAGDWQREAPARLQRELDALPMAAFTETPAGRARIETYTVMHDRQGPSYAVVFGRLEQGGARFIANLPPDRALLEDLQRREGLGRAGSVEHRDGHNLFTPDP